MTKILFVCHGNICRSPMAEFIMKDIVRKQGIQGDFYISSAATSSEEIGNDIHYGTKAKLREMGIPFFKRQAVQLQQADYEKYDYLIAMDKNNLRNIRHIVGPDLEEKVKLLLEFAGEYKDIADPWYTGNFDVTYDDVTKGCQGLLQQLLQQNNV